MPVSKRHLARRIKLQVKPKSHPTSAIMKHHRFGRVQQAQMFLGRVFSYHVTRGWRSDHA